ncbi:MAG: DUF721 domain-containing protein [Candidatus Altimarinota bacterium]
MSFSHLKDLIPKAANKLHLHGEMNAALVLNRAGTALREVFAEQISRQIQLKKFQEGILWCVVSHPVIAQELQMKSPVIREKINDAFGQVVVKQIRSFQEAAEPEEAF